MDRNAGTLVVVVACLLAGCADRVSGPQAVRMVAALEEHAEVADEWGRLNLGGSLPWLHGLGVRVPTIRIEWNGRPDRFHALVYERRMEPAHGLGPEDGCWGDGRALYLWSPDRLLRGVVLSGGDTTGTFGLPPQPCPALPARVPSLLVTAAERAPSEEAGYTHEQFGGREGSGFLSHGVSRGPCVFLAPGAAEQLLEEVGATCEMTQHRVSLQARFEGSRYKPRRCGDLELPGPAGAAAPLAIRVPEAIVVGVRLTFDCSLEAARRYCLPPSPRVVECRDE